LALAAAVVSNATNVCPFRLYYGIWLWLQTAGLPDSYKNII